MKNIFDKYNRPVRDLRISVTDRCNFRCTYCMPKEVYGEAFKFLPKEELLDFDEIEKIAKSFAALGVTKIRLTGGEPLVRKNIEDLISKKINHTSDDIDVWDAALSPGYGQISEKTLDALNLMARKEGVFLDPVYTAKTFSGLLDLVDQGIIRKNQTVLMMHTGGLPAIFGYEQKILHQ